MVIITVYCGGYYSYRSGTFNGISNIYLTGTYAEHQLEITN